MSDNGENDDEFQGEYQVENVDAEFDDWVEDLNACENEIQSQAADVDGEQVAGMA